MASTWADLWQRPDQQAAKALAAGDYAKAAALATDASRRGSAEYKRGNYQLALDNFSRSTGADADYNRGNALAKLGRYQDAIAAYDKSIKENPGDEDARANKAAVEALLKQQQAQQQASNAQGKQSQKDQSQSDRSGQNSSQSKAGGADLQKWRERPERRLPGTAAASGECEPGQCRRADRRSPPARTAKTNRARTRLLPRQANSNRRRARLRRSRQSRETNLPRLPKSWRNSERARRKRTRNRLRAPRLARMPRVRCKRRRMRSGKRTAGSADSAQPLDREERMAAEQWLRRIPDDPGGLLRRKFLYQYRQRAQHMPASINHGTLRRSSS